MSPRAHSDVDHWRHEAQRLLGLVARSNADRQALHVALEDIITICETTDTPTTRLLHVHARAIAAINEELGVFSPYAPGR